MAIPLKYNLRNLRVRWITALMTVLGIAFVTAIFEGWSALAVGMEHTLVASGHPLNLIVLRAGATETQSHVSKEQADRVAELAGIVKDEAGKPLVSRELVALANMTKKNGRKVNLALRGVGPNARAVRAGLTLVEGRWQRPALGELVVGAGAHERFADLNVGDQPFIRGRRWTVVGVFAAGGQAYESEVWGDVDDLKAQFHREFSTVLARCRDDATLLRLARLVKDDKQIQLEGKRHSDYYQEHNQGAQMLKAIGAVLAIVLSIGAIFGAANTMYAAVAARGREIATLRVLGFSRLAIWFSFLVESAFLGLAGGVFGSALARATVHGMTTGSVNWQTFSELAFHYRVSFELMGFGTALAVVMGMVGGFFPAFRASRQTIAAALRGL